jgi:hypothetical protein
MTNNSDLINQVVATQSNAFGKDSLEREQDKAMVKKNREEYEADLRRQADLKKAR